MKAKWASAIDPEADGVLLHLSTEAALVIAAICGAIGGGDGTVHDLTGPMYHVFAEMGIEIYSESLFDVTSIAAKQNGLSIVQEKAEYV